MMGEKIGAVLVIGGGIAGIQAALDLAGTGIKAYLLERSPAIGGRMAQLDKTFPTNDCAMCIISPKLVEAARHLNVEIITDAELVALSGRPGLFTARIRRHPRYVDVAKCTGCADCAAVCPVALPDEFNAGLSRRKAIHRPFPQAVPNTFLVSKKGVSPCKAGCPAETSAQGYVALIREGRYAEALEVVMRNNPFPASVGRVCNHPCERACNRGKLDSPVAICSLKRFVADWVYENKATLPARKTPPSERPKARIAVVGAGPAGLSCAHFLVRIGYKVTVFDALPVAGGMMRVGIPAYRLPREVLQREIDAVVSQGVELRLSTPVRDIKGLLKEGYDAVYVAVGAHKPQALGIKGEGAAGVQYGVPFLKAVNLASDRRGMPDVAERVVVIGGGNTAVDAARTALRLGAREVTILYRRSRQEMPADGKEVDEALREGVALELLAAPKEIVVEDGRAVGLRCGRMELKEPDRSGRRRPVPIEGSDFTIEAGTIIIAVAQAPETSALSGIGVGTGDVLAVDPRTLAAETPGIFAGGDARRGPATVIEAIADGRRGAVSIDRYLRKAPLLEEGEEDEVRTAELTVDEVKAALAAGAASPAPRLAAPSIPMDRRDLSREVELAFSEEEARREAARCLDCGICAECLLCVDACQAEAIEHHQKVKEEEIRVGAVIMAPGYELEDPRLFPELGYGRYRNVVTNLEFERMLSASGPLGGDLKLSDGRKPRKIAFLQCVGSRGRRNAYCSSVCCLAAVKEAVIAREHLPEAEAAVFYMDVRAQGKEFDSYCERARGDYGVRFIRSHVSRLAQRPQSGAVLIDYVDGQGLPRREEFDLAVLAMAMKPAAGAKELARRLGVELDENDFCKGGPFDQISTSRPGVFACGVFTGPRDIPETVVQASGAAAAAAGIIAEARGTLSRVKEYPPVRDVTGQEPRIGVFVCHCGINIGGVVDVPEVVAYARTLPQVAHVEENLYTCSQDTQERMKQTISEHGLNRIVVASCSPRTHEPLFQETIREAGLNKYLFEMANIRDQCSWVHMHQPREATQKAKELLRMTVAKAARSQPLDEPRLAVNKQALVIGGGLAGITAALALAGQGFSSLIVEREEKLGGNLLGIYSTIDGGNVGQLLESLVAEVKRTPQIEVLTGAVVKSMEGYVGNFRTVIDAGGLTKTFEHGVVIVAVGAKEGRPEGYLYGRDKDVLTQRELEGRLAAEEDFIKQKRLVAMIQCVGSRTPEHPSCSRICCLMAVKNALRIKELSPKTEVAVLYRDMRTYGLMERYYGLARQRGVLFIPYEAQEPPTVTRRGALELRVGDATLGREILLNPDLVVLSSAVVAEGNEPLAKMLKVPLTAEGFFLEAHLKLRPVDFATDGVFVAGMAHFPKTIPETVAQAKAAAARAAAVIARGYVDVMPTISVVDETRCLGCGLCESLCPFQAIRVSELTKKAEVLAASCKGCGICGASCPRRAATVRHFTDGELIAQIEALVEDRRGVLD